MVRTVRSWRQCSGSKLARSREKDIKDMGVDKSFDASIKLRIRTTLNYGAAAKSNGHSPSSFSTNFIGHPPRVLYTVFEN